MLYKDYITRSCSCRSTNALQQLLFWFTGVRVSVIPPSIIRSYGRTISLVATFETKHQKHAMAIHRHRSFSSLGRNTAIKGVLGRPFGVPPGNSSSWLWRVSDPTGMKA